MTGMTELTYTGIFLAVFAQQFCLPVPAMLLLLTAGGLAAHGDHHLRVSLVLLSGVLGCLAADAFWFWMGRRWGSRVIRVVCSFTSDPAHSRKRARDVFGKWGLRLLLFAKFVPGLDGVSPPLAGAEGATVRNFVLYDGAGSVIWTGVYMLAGYLFANQVHTFMVLLNRFIHLALLVVGVPLLLYVLWRIWTLARMIKHLRLRSITPALLQARLDAGDPVAIFDLMNYEARDGEQLGIPSALRVDPQRLKSGPRVQVPDNVDVVLYCGSRNDFVSARVAEVLQKREFTRVWVLEGGLENWIAEGFAVTTEVTPRDVVAARLGITLPPES